jgi:hypothetical protein
MATADREGETGNGGRAGAEVGLEKPVGELEALFPLLLPTPLFGWRPKPCPLQVGYKISIRVLTESKL